jgi:hypothetical protein
LESVGINPQTNRYTPVYGSFYSRRLPDYQRLDIRVQKQSNYAFGDVRYFLDILNVTDADNLGTRDYEFFPPASPGGNPGVLIDDESGIPFFVAFGVELDF